MSAGNAGAQPRWQHASGPTGALGLGPPSESGEESQQSRGLPHTTQRCGLARAVGFVFTPGGRAAVIVLWAVLTVCGLLVTPGVLAELSTTMPPVPGTPSDKAMHAMRQYFPTMRASNAVLVASKDKQPLVNFVEGSTCKLESNIKNGTQGVLLDLSCSNDTALGGGCIRSADIFEELDDLVHQLVDLLEALGKVSKAQGDEITMLFKTVVLDQLSQHLPSISHCPELGTGHLAEEWQNLAEQISTTLATKYSHCKNTVVSFLSAPKMSVTKTFAVPLPGQSEKMNVTVAATIPAGTFWDLFRTQLLAEGGMTMLIATATTTCNGTAAFPGRQVDKDISKAIQHLARDAHPSLTAEVSSQSFMFDAILGGIQETMNLSTWTMPIALLILAVMTGNVRLIICTLVNLITCLAASFLVIYPIAKHVEVNTTVPSMMVAVALGMSIDYSLFLLSRFQKEVDAGRSAPRAAEIMLHTSGKIVLVSGITLLLCFLVMLFLPAAFIATMGACASLTVFMAIFASLTLTPSLLLTFPGFFSSSRNFGCSSDACCCCPRRRPARTVVAGPMENMTVQLQDGASEADHNEVLNKRMAASCWPKYGACIQRFGLPVILVLIVVAVPFGLLSLPRMSYSCGLISFMPAGADATNSVLKLTDAFGSGVLFPTALVVVPPRRRVATEKDRQEWLKTACEALRTVAHDVNTDSSVAPFTAAAFTGAMIVNGNCTGMGFGEWSHRGGEHSATEVMISYSVDPFSTEGQAWVTRMRDALDKQSAVAEWYLDGAGPIQMDAAAACFKAFPFIILLMMGVVLVLIGISFKSVVAPFRAVFCLMWMLVMTFGAAVFVFQFGVLDWLDWGQLGRRDTGGMSWMSPMIACSVIVGLGLDYDIFYTESVLEECERGHSETEAAVRALTETANTISAAGLIMVIAFGSLLLGSTPTLNEIAFLLVVGVLIDCFITTKMIMPSAMYRLGRLNFWPHKFPKREATSPAPRHEVVLVD